MERDGSFSPPSHGPRSLWFLHHLAPQRAAYNIAAAARLLSPVDPEALECALQGLVDRHAALRMAFPAVDGEPCQRIAEAPHPHPLSHPLPAAGRGAPPPSQ